MSASITIEKAIEHLDAYGRRQGPAFEIFVDESRNFKSTFQQKKLNQFSLSSSRRLGVRIVDGQQEGCAFTENFSVAELEKTFQEALSTARILQKPYQPELYVPQSLPQLEDIYNADLEQVSVEKKLAKNQVLEASGLETDARIASVPYNAYGDFYRRIHILNSKGLNAGYQANGCYAFASALAREGSSNAMESEAVISRRFEDLDTEAVGREAARKALRMLGAVAPKTGTYPVVLSREASQSLVAALLPHFSAESVTQGTSLLSERLGQKIFSPHIHFVDDPFFPGAFHSRPFDSEGAASQKTVVVEGGVLKTFLTNSVYAQKMGLKNTANARRTPSSELSVEVSNFFVKPGLSPLADLLNSYPQVIHIHRLKGMQGFNSISGNFSIEAEGSLCENGQWVQALANFVVAGNVMDALAAVEGVSNDFKMSSAQVIAPSILIPQLTIAGK